MPRKPAKTIENPMQQIEVAINEPVGKYLSDEADRLGISDTELKERLAAKLDNDDPLDWDVILPEYEQIIKAIAIDLEAERSVRRLNETTEPAIEEQAPASVVEPPIIEEEAQQKKRVGRKKKESTALTKKKLEAIQDNRKNASQTQAGVKETLTTLQAQEGAQDGANAATAYLHSLVTNMTNIKGEGLAMIAAEMLQQTANKSNFNPDEVLEKIGIPLSSETREKLNQVMGEVLGKQQEATEEMTDTAWGNGYNVHDELTRLKNLMNLSN